MVQVLVRTDSTGECAVVLRDDERLLGGEGVRWRWVCETDDELEAYAVFQRLQAHIERRRAVARRENADAPAVYTEAAGAGATARPTHRP